MKTCWVAQFCTSFSDRTELKKVVSWATGRFRHARDDQSGMGWTKQNKKMLDENWKNTQIRYAAIIGCWFSDGAKKSKQEATQEKQTENKTETRGMGEMKGVLKTDGKGEQLHQQWKQLSTKYDLIWMGWSRRSSNLISSWHERVEVHQWGSFPQETWWPFGVFSGHRWGYVTCGWMQEIS